MAAIIDLSKPIIYQKNKKKLSDPVLFFVSSTLPMALNIIN